MAMTITTCDMCGKEIADEKTIVRAGAGIFRMLGAKEFCASCGKPVVQFLKRVEKRLQRNETPHRART